MAKLDRWERVALLEEVIEAMDECAQKLRSLDDPVIEAYCLADFEGREGGWLGEFARDVLERKLRVYREGGEDDED